MSHKIVVDFMNGIFGKIDLSNKIKARSNPVKPLVPVEKPPIPLGSIEKAPDLRLKRPLGILPEAMIVSGFHKHKIKVRANGDHKAPERLEKLKEILCLEHKMESGSSKQKLSAARHTFQRGTNRERFYAKLVRKEIK